MAGAERVSGSRFLKEKGVKTIQGYDGNWVLNAEALAIPRARLVGSVGCAEPSSASPTLQKTFLNTL